jgi:hypothetical protein
MAWEPTRIAAWLRLSLEQVHAAVEYILHHKLEVIRAYHDMLEREARGNPPELQARLDACRGKARERAEQLHRHGVKEENHARAAGGCQL